MKKKYVAAIMAAVALCMTACGGASGSTEQETSDAGEESTEEAAGEEPAADDQPVLYENLTSKLVSLGEYKGLKVTKISAEVSDEDVQKEVKERKKPYAELKTAERAAEPGDVVIIDYTGYVDGETRDGMHDTEHALELGSNSFIPGFEEQLVGSEAGSDVELNVTFPENYHAELAGQDAVFEVHVHEVQAYDFSGVDDAVIKEKLNYENEEALTAAVREELEADAQKEAEETLEYELVQKLLEGCEFEIQDADVKAYTDQMMSEYVSYAEMYQMDLDTFLQNNLGATEEQVRAMYRQTAEFRVKMTLAFFAIAEAEGMEVTEEEYQARLNEIMSQYGYEDSAQVETLYGRSMIEEELIQQKAIEFLIDNAAIS